MKKLGSLRMLFIAITFSVTVTIASAQTFNIVEDFDYYNGANPLYGTIVQGPNGNLYGMTENGGANGDYGTIFEITPAGRLNLYSFCSQTNCLDGRNPAGGIILANGSLYGTTAYGGTNSASGTVFKIDATGRLTTLYNFCQHVGFGGICTDGSSPTGAMVHATNGNFYGTTFGGGGPLGSFGTVFEITPSGTLTTLYRFCPQIGCADGSFPTGALIQATDGNIYGTTRVGGEGGGTIFRITPAGEFTVLYTFCSQSGCTDGGNPTAGLIQASDGNFYGTTAGGGIFKGDDCQVGGCGTVFRISPAGKFTTLYRFCPESGCVDGRGPEGGVIQASDGNLYGTTTGGGSGKWGTIFRIASSSGLTTLYSFCSQTNCTDGSGPQAGLVQASNGLLYGTTYTGGTGTNCSFNQCGTVFSLSFSLSSQFEQALALSK